MRRNIFQKALAHRIIFKLCRLFLQQVMRLQQNCRHIGVVLLYQSLN